MSIKLNPVPGQYYVNLTGQLIKVRCLLYAEGAVSRVLLEYLDGHQLNVQIDEWAWLDLKPYSDWFLEQDDRRSEGEREV